MDAAEHVSGGRSRDRDDAYRRLLNQGPVAIIELDHRGRFVMLNATAEEIFGAAGATCVGADGRQVLQIAGRQRVTNSAISGWQRASNVQVVPIRLCPNVKRQVAAALSGSSKVNMLRRAANADALINASLNRTRYNAGDVFAVQRSGSQLTVFVY